MSAGKLIATLPENLLKECPALVESEKPEDFASTVAVNTTHHKICRKNHNELVNLINSVKAQPDE